MPAKSHPKSRPKTHKHKPGKFSMAEVHKLSKFVKKVAPSMKFRRGRKGKGMSGGAMGDSQDFSYDDKQGREQDEYMRNYMLARDMIRAGHPEKEVLAKFPMLR